MAPSAARVSGDGRMSCALSYAVVTRPVKYFAPQSKPIGVPPANATILISPERNRARQRITGGECLLHHLVQPALIDRT